MFKEHHFVEVKEYPVRGREKVPHKAASASSPDGGVNSSVHQSKVLE